MTTTTFVILSRHNKWSEHHRREAVKQIQAMEDELEAIKHLLAALRCAPLDSPSLPHIVDALRALPRDKQDTPDPAPEDQRGGS